MKLLVTGGAGFIGSNYVHYVLARHTADEIVCLDALTYAGNMQALQPALQNPRFRFVEGDVTDPRILGVLFGAHHFDCIVNFAAESHVDRSIDDPTPFVKTNVLGVQILLDAAREHKVKRFLQVSTDEVYGDLPLEGGASFDESAPLRPSSPYAASKAAADLLVLAAARTYHQDVVITRSTNNLGPWQHREKLIPTVIALARNDRPVPIYGTGANVRDWLYVTDNCQAIDLVLREGKTGEVYNIGAHNERCNLEMAKAILDRLGKPHSLLRHVSDRAGHDLRYAVATDKIQALGWQPTVALDEALDVTVQWYLERE